MPTPEEAREALVPEAAQVDLSLPDDLTHDERVARLGEMGDELRRVTGRKSGVTPEQYRGEGQQPVWGVWWSNDEDDEENR